MSPAAAVSDFIVRVAQARAADYSAIPLSRAVVCADLFDEQPCETVHAALDGLCPRCGSSQAVALSALLGRRPQAVEEPLVDLSRDLASVGFPS